MNRKGIILAGCFLALTVVNRLPAQSNTVELYGGYVYSKVNPLPGIARTNMNGWVGSVTGYPARWFGVGTEISAVFGDITPPSSAGAKALSGKEYSYLFGPQFRFVNQEKVQSSFKFLLGGVFGQVNLPSGLSAEASEALLASGYTGFNQTKFAMMAAVPVDISVSRVLAIRVEPGLFVTNFNQHKQGNFRLSIGPVFRFGGER